MARIKFGALVTSGSGSVGGHTIQNSKGGMQLRTKPSYKGRPSFAQSLIRSYNSKLQEGWRLLTDTQRKEWDTFAFSHSISNQKGTDHFISGHSLWLKYNFEYISHNLPFISSPFLYTGVFPGPELILNGSFVDESIWKFTSNFFWGLNHASFSALASSYISQAVVICNACIFTLSFDIIGVGASALLYFRNDAFASLFEPPYNTYFPFSEGSHSIQLTSKATSTQFVAYASAGGTPFDITNISFRLTSV